MNNEINEILKNQQSKLKQSEKLKYLIELKKLCIVIGNS